MVCFNEHPVAFVLSSGANLGAVQVGMLRALSEHGIWPDLVVGCSVGALNGASLAQDPTPAGVARMDQIWRTIEGKDLMPRQWMPSAVALSRRGEAIHPNDGLRQLLERTLTASTFEELRIPFHCVATDIVHGDEAWFHQGPLIDAVLASAAMPAMFPSVAIGGRRLLDGAIVNEVPVDRAAALGARTLYVLEVGSLARSWSEPRRPLDTLMEASGIARRHRFRAALEALPDEITVHVLPQGEPPRLRPHDFSRGAELSAAAYTASSAFLDELQGAAPAAEVGSPP